MAKVILTKAVGGDGAQVVLGTDDSGNVQLAITYPIAKLIQPADQVIDELVAKVESALGTPAWLGAILAPLDAAAKAELAALLSA